MIITYILRKIRCHKNVLLIIDDITGVNENTQTQMGHLILLFSYYSANLKTKRVDDYLNNDNFEKVNKINVNSIIANNHKLLLFFRLSWLLIQ